MDENNNLNRTDSGQPQNEYTGEYGNSVETDGSADSVYSYSYKNGANNAESTHSGDYYAGNNNAESTMNADSRVTKAAMTHRTDLNLHTKMKIRIRKLILMKRI